MSTKTPKFEIWEARDGWRWRFLAKNGKLIAESGEAYSSRSGAVRARNRFELLVLLQSEHGYV
jgi:uncharacterized protein YegP (UPF0339 family)